VIFRIYLWAIDTTIGGVAVAINAGVVAAWVLLDLAGRAWR
jgi:hypothetical protein